MEKVIKLRNNGFLHLLIGLVLLFAPVGLVFYSEVLRQKESFVEGP